jgi:hypothetical protein
MDAHEGSSSPLTGTVSEIRADGDGPSIRSVFGATAALQLVMLLAVFYVAVWAPPLRIAAVIWLVFVLGFVVFAVIRLRSISRGTRQRTRLELDGLQIRYTDWKGHQVACSRAAVRRAELLLITDKSRTSNLIVFQDVEGATLMSIPSGLFTGDAVDGLLSELGVGPMGRRFVNSKAELAAAAPGLVLAGFYVAGNTPFDRSPASRRIVLGFLVAIVAFLVVFVILASRT